MHSFKTELAQIRASLTQPGNGDQGLSDGDRDQLGELYEPTVKLISNANQGLADNIEAKFSALTDTIQTLQEQMSQSNTTLFSGVVKSTLNNFKEVENSPEFKEKLDSNVPGGGGLTYRDLWEDAGEGEQPRGATRNRRYGKD